MVVSESAKTGILTRKSGRAEGMYSIFVFVWAAVQSVPKFMLILSEIKLHWMSYWEMSILKENYSILLSEIF